MVSLFDQYPDKVKPPREVASCCNRLVAPDHIDPETWAFMHHLAHSRVPFLPSTLARIAQVDIADAERAIRVALHRGWVTPVPPEAYMDDDPGLWVGRLAAHRR